jgi:hypothetical protein
MHNRIIQIRSHSARMVTVSQWQAQREIWPVKSAPALDILLGAARSSQLGGQSAGALIDRRRSTGRSKYLFPPVAICGNDRPEVPP